MISAMLLGAVSAALSLLAFCVARWPVGWMKLWSPRREFLAVEYLSPPERRFLLHIRFRATLAGLGLLAIAILLPVIGAMSFRLPSRAWGEYRPASSAGPQDPNSIPRKTVGLDVPTLRAALTTYLACSADLSFSAYVGNGESYPPFRAERITDPSPLPGK